MQGSWSQWADVDMSRLSNCIAIVLEKQPMFAIIICEDRGVNAATFSSLQRGTLLGRGEGHEEGGGGGLRGVSGVRHGEVHHHHHLIML